MSVFDKLRLRKKYLCESHRISTASSNSSQFGAGDIRILLFRESEQRGRKLLFDSISTNSNFQKDEKETENFFNQVNGDDIKLLGEMVFGTVAMAYNGPSFKIHSMQTPPSIMCTKVFPDLESSYKQRNKLSDENLGHSGSSSGSVTQNSRPSSGYFSTSSLTLGNVKSSPGSSHSSGFNINVPFPLTASNQSLDKSSSSSIGSSISSIRRRWLRAVSTSFTFSESDDLFGYYGDDNGPCKDDRRHKTRFGLSMLIRLIHNSEKSMINILLEHVALLEGMLDRLRYYCIESLKKSKQNNDFVEKFQKASFYCTSWLCHLFQSQNCPQLLIWHDVLLCSINTSSDNRTSLLLYQNLEQMCNLLNKIDTKTTNFFLSTFITAILTHHLGWIRTVIPESDYKLPEKWENWYPYNPLWAQLGDLHGALGNPLKTVQTVIAGTSARKQLIKSVLSFASYFLRSGVVQKTIQERYTFRDDIEKSILILQNNQGQFPSATEGVDNSERENLKTADEPEINKPNKLKRTGTFQNIMNIYGLTQNVAFQEARSLHCKDVCDVGPVNDGCNDESDYPSSTVQIIISASPSKHNQDESLKSILYRRRSSSLTDLDRFQRTRQDEAFDNNNEEPKPQFVNNRHKAFHSSEELNSERRRSVYFTLGDEDVLHGRNHRSVCQCTRQFASLSLAKTPRSVVQRLPAFQSNERFCEICRDPKTASPNEPANSVAHFGMTFTDNSSVQNDSTNLSLEELLRRNCVVELPMPEYKIFHQKISDEILKSDSQNLATAGFTKSLLDTQIETCPSVCWNSCLKTKYTWGMIMQGLVKTEPVEERKEKRTRQLKSEWWHFIQEEMNFLAKFPILDQSVDEAVCILADLDVCQVGLLSNKFHSHEVPLPVGMSRLVSNMLEAFLYLWKKYKSPEHCIALLETRLREMWLRSEVLAQMLMITNVGDVSIDNITNALDIEAADLPLLLAVATTHTPEIAQRFGLSFA